MGQSPYIKENDLKFYYIEIMINKMKVCDFWLVDKIHKLKFFYLHNKQEAFWKIKCDELKRNVGGWLSRQCQVSREVHYSIKATLEEDDDGREKR